MDAFDLAVIGGGIVGAGVARLAARNGLAVILFERGDLASGTSSASSHMLHGGLRYLEHAQFGMVRESLAERAAALRMAGPLAKPVRFLVPLRAGSRLGPLRLRAGLALYDALAGGANLERRGWASASEARALEPDLAPEGLLGAGLYTDAVVDDARLTVAVARDAAAYGATIRTYVEVTGARRAAAGAEIEFRDRLDGTTGAVRARALVNATGPWTDATRRTLLAGLAPGPDAAAAPLLGPSRGAHLVYPALTRGHGVLLLAASDGRVFFLVPFGDRTLVGTTETEAPSPPPDAAFAPSVAELRYLRREVARALPAAAAVRPIAVTSGIRPLLRSTRRVGAAPREHRVIAEGPLLTIAGGKLTTFRVMARQATRAAMAALGRSGATIADSDDPLPVPFEASGSHDDLAAFAVHHEFARTLVDVVRRRTRLWLAPDRGRARAAALAECMATYLGWNEARRQAELDGFERGLAEEARWIDQAMEDG